MSEQWLRDYTMLALRIDKVMRTVTELPYVDGYYGPRAWKAQVEIEPEVEANDLARAAMALTDALPAQGFEPGRAAFLAKQVVAMETVCRRLSGETFSLQEEVRRCFDVQAAWIPDARFQEALDIYREALPGKGTLARRLHEWREQYRPAQQYARFSSTTAHILASDQFSSITSRMLAEVRRRTRRLVDLPSEEWVDVHTVKDKLFGAATFYQGNFHTLIEINTDSPLNVLMLLEDLCHEAYPGHHTEFALKEQVLYRQRGYTEQSVPIVLSPPCLVSEGIATSAREMIFAPGELEAWLAEEIYPLLGLRPDPVDLSALHRASDILEGVWCNAVMLLRDGHAEDVVQDYLVKYLHPAGSVEHLKRPFHDIYVCTYYYGKQLLAPLLSGPQRLPAFRRVLTEQLISSDLM